MDFEMSLNLELVEKKSWIQKLMNQKTWTYLTSAEFRSILKFYGQMPENTELIFFAGK